MKKNIMLLKIISYLKTERNKFNSIISKGGMVVFLIKNK